MFRYCDISRLSGASGRSRAGRHGHSSHSCSLVYRAAYVPIRPVQPPAPQIVHNTVHQTVVHLHQTTHQHIRSHITTATGRHGGPTLLLRQDAALPPGRDAIDPSRPAWTARRLLRVLSRESARQIMRPFYHEMFRSFLVQEQEGHRGRPAQALLLVRTILGRRQTLEALRRSYRQTTQRLDGTIFYDLILRRYVRRRAPDGEGVAVRRYASRISPVPDDLRRLPAARRSPLPPEPQDHATPRPPAAPDTQAVSRPVSGPRLDAAGLQILARSVAEILRRQDRLESLRRGGT